MSGTIHFNDLLDLTTPPGQTMTIESINPGILVENGVFYYQLLPNQLVKIERGEWPFMGGRLILRGDGTQLRPADRQRLTFEVVGLDAKTFVDSLGFKEIAATGTFDGVLPMIFDEDGGRIVGGRLDARPPGGTLSYVGVINRADMGMMANIAFDALKELRYRSMIVRLDGDLAGEFTSRLSIEQLGLAAKAVRRRSSAMRSRKVPFRFNITIRGPFRALIQTAKSYRTRASRSTPSCRVRSRTFPASSPRCVAATKSNSRPRPRSRKPSPRPHQARDDHDQAPQYVAAARRRFGRPAAVELHLGQDARQADRDQSERQHQAGGAGAPARDVEQLINQNPQAFPPKPPK